MQSVQWVLRGAFRTALKAVMQEILDGTEANTELRVTRGWTDPQATPSTDPHGMPRSGTPTVCEEHCLPDERVPFQRRQHTHIQSVGGVVRMTTMKCERPHVPCHSPRWVNSVGRSSCGSRHIATLRALTDPGKRPPLPRTPLSREVADAQPSTALQLDSIKFPTCLGKGRRGAAAGPSGMTSNHLFPVLENEVGSDLLCRVASLLAVGQVPDSILEQVRLGRMTALSKPDGGVRAL